MELVGSETDLRRKTIFVRILQHAILDQRLAGITIPELLDTLIQTLKESINSGPKESPDLTSMQVSLTDAIGSLGAHLSYPNQINEIVSFLVNRVQFEKTPANLDKNDQTFLFFILMSLVNIVKNNGIGSSDPSFGPGSLCYNLFVPLLIHFSSQLEEIRVQLYYLLASIINASKLDKKLENVKMEFFEGLHSGLGSYALIQTNLAVDYILLGNLLCNSIAANGPSELGYSVPLLFHAQEQLPHRSLSSSQKRAFAAMILEYFSFVANYFELSELGKYVEGLRFQRQNARQHSPKIFLTDEAAESLRHKSFS